MRIRRLLGVVAAVAVTAALVVGFDAADAVTPPVARLSGNDRYATAAAVATNYAPGVPAVFIATGTTFPDALAAAPAAILAGGPVLLTERDQLPPITGSALERLAPQSVVVVGGTGAVSNDVILQIRQRTGAPVVRVDGGDRFGTAAAVAANYPAGVPIAYVASGRDFPDALSASAVVGGLGGPLLLVEPNGIPAATAAQLDRLDPEVIVIAGGQGAVSAGVRDQLLAYSPEVLRESGGDRYGTSAAISANSFSPGQTLVYLATGVDFPDALAGAAVAGAAPAPVLLSRPDCVPAIVKAEIDRLGPSAVILLGGTRALSPNVAALTVCFGETPPTTTPPPSAVTFGDGAWAIGSGSGAIPAGTYRTRSGNSGCYWSRRSGFTESVDDVIAVSVSNNHQVVTISPTDALFVTQGCGTWTSDLSAITTSPFAPFADGTWIVGTDISAGRWVAPGGPACFWERRSSFGGQFSDVIENQNAVTNPVVNLQDGDRAFYSENCGTWSKPSGLPSTG